MPEHLTLIILALAYFLVENTKAHTQVKADPDNKTAQAINSIYSLAILYCSIYIIWGTVYWSGQLAQWMIVLFSGAG